MAIITAPSMADTVYQGPQGNLSVAEGWYPFSGTEKPGDIIELLALPIGMRIYGLNMSSDKLGIYVSIRFNGMSLISTTSCASAFEKYTPIKPYSTKTPSDKLVAVVGSTVSTNIFVPGLLTVSLFYTAVGY
ncbi:TPA: hypothetical protein ACPZQZ_001961 [Yersinia enterocolitica]|uniref:hypothetical protein n=1 Tax=Yersinia enterocolitica TaxID=630 RepID=UPI0002E22B66|nr:hypothetical protein [Yersinia enterocolitica]